MADRAAILSEFLTRTGWGHAERQPLTGDASSRRYERIVRITGESAILMEVGPAASDSLQPFVRIAAHLKRIGLSAPEILARDSATGLLLLEDFGDDLFANLMRRDPSCEALLYEAAIDVLVHLRHSSLPDEFPQFQPQQMAEFAAIAYEWYRADRVRDDTAGSALIEEMSRLLSLVQPEHPILALRDFHSENMIWLPAKSGVRKVGLLDFQDAFLCHPAYDLVSLLRDARRDISADLVRPLTQRYVLATGCNPDDLDRAIAVYGAQRNLRILGVFARLSKRDGKPHYIDLLPRVWGHLLIDLAHPELDRLRRIVLADLPEPTVELLDALKPKCPTSQHP